MTARVGLILALAVVGIVAASASPPPDPPPRLPPPLAFTNFIPPKP